ncbi:hypothetical protein NJ7G_3625 [Natrinema sp. J7-2]|nr:hypothetical protein NJ7G_3625 [Natrinema sp. J7-2]
MADDRSGFVPTGTRQRRSNRTALARGPRSFYPTIAHVGA